MKVKEIGFLWRCANLRCEELMGNSTDLSKIPKEWTCPKCGMVNQYHYGKIVFKVKKDARTL